MNSFHILYAQEPGTYRTTTSTSVMGNAPFGSMVHGAAARVRITYVYVVLLGKLFMRGLFIFVNITLFPSQWGRQRESTVETLRSSRTIKLETRWMAEYGIKKNCVVTKEEKKKNGNSSHNRRFHNSQSASIIKIIILLIKVIILYM